MPPTRSVNSRGRTGFERFVRTMKGDVLHERVSRQPQFRLRTPMVHTVAGPRKSLAAINLTSSSPPSPMPTNRPAVARKKSGAAGRRLWDGRTVFRSSRRESLAQSSSCLSLSGSGAHSKVSGLRIRARRAEMKCGRTCLRPRDRFRQP